MVAWADADVVRVLRVGATALRVFLPDSRERVVAVKPRLAAVLGDDVRPRSRAPGRERRFPYPAKA